METAPATPRASVAREVRRRIERSGDRVWRFEDFQDLPPQAVGQALSRLGRSGELRRLSKGVYFRPRPTAFGPSRPNPADLQRLVAEEGGVFPSGTGAAAALGLTTQNPARAEVATTRASLPRKLLGKHAVVHTRRPAAWSTLGREDAALLEVLRDRARASELSPDETVRRLVAALRERGRFRRLVAVAETEPPRVRAMLGALGEHLDAPTSLLRTLRRSLNPLSRYDFGVLAALPTASRWQAKDRRLS